MAIVTYDGNDSITFFTHLKQDVHVLHLAGRALGGSGGGGGSGCSGSVLGDDDSRDIQSLARHRRRVHVTGGGGGNIIGDGLWAVSAAVVFRGRGGEEPNDMRPAAAVPETCWTDRDVA
ncbi:Hypothetical protein CINCED_3A000548 [Cinara cedri]|uniref:Uncharacterized protein n=1 Tax=Cinara cedri TaxID=506608 RepID=A0A5E4MVR9_9HEMI|nr:Hypothetical protein CINCED_3A000548 [Cinara cedri]